MRHEPRPSKAERTKSRNVNNENLLRQARRGPIVGSRKETVQIASIEGKRPNFRDIVGVTHNAPSATRSAKIRWEETAGRKGDGELLVNVPSNSLLVPAAEVARTIVMGFVCQLGNVSVGVPNKEKVDRYEWQPSSRKNEVKKRLMRCQTCWTTPTRERNE
jgi:hypothetical protein